MQVIDLGSVDPADAAILLVELAEDLRPSDIDEIAATTGEAPATALVSAVMLSSHAWIALDAVGNPLVAFGAAPADLDDPSEGIVWMLGSPRMDEPANALGILRRTPEYLGTLLDAYPTLSNYVDARNQKSILWLLSAGFEIDDVAFDHGLGGETFFHFSRRRDLV